MAINNRTLTIFSLITITLLMFNCKGEQKINKVNNQERSDIQVIDLKPREGSDGPFRRVIIGTSAIDSFPSFLKGIPAYDTVRLQQSIFFSKRDLDQLYANNQLDSTKYPRKSIKRGVYLINGYHENKQFIIVDGNNDYDFSNDEIFWYDPKVKEQLPYNLELRNSLPNVIVTYDDYNGNEIFKNKITIKPLPWKIPYNEKIGEKFLKDIYQVRLEYNKYWVGNFLVDDSIAYKLAINRSAFGPDILFQKREKDFAFVSSQYSEVYKLKDTVQLKDHYYRIDSVTMSYEKLFLRKLSIISPVWGYRRNETTVNFNYTNIKGNQRVLKDLLHDKDFVLLDYWGTWCAPCKELTPSLKEIHEKYGDFTNILSLAYDKEKLPVQNYISKNSLEWEHIFLQGDAKNGKIKQPELIEKFSIKAYPTFILIDKNLKIVTRGIGKKGLDSVLEILITMRAAKEFQKKKANN